MAHWVTRRNNSYFVLEDLEDVTVHIEDMIVSSLPGGGLRLFLIKR